MHFAETGKLGLGILEALGLRSDEARKVQLTAEAGAFTVVSVEYILTKEEAAVLETMFGTQLLQYELRPKS